MDRINRFLRGVVELFDNEQAVSNASHLLNQRASEDRLVLALVGRLPHDATRAA